MAGNLTPHLTSYPAHVKLEIGGITLPSEGVVNFHVAPGLAIVFRKSFPGWPTFLARYRAYVIASKFFVVDTITFERINRLTSNFAHVETEQK